MRPAMRWDSPRRCGTASTFTSSATRIGRHTTRTATRSGCRRMCRTGGRWERRSLRAATSRDVTRTCSNYTDEGVAVQLSLADRTVLVTGGGSGIGKGVAAAVVAAGGNAMLVGRNADRLAV